MEFNSIVNSVRKRTLLTEEKLKTIYDLCCDTFNVNGDIVEVGCCHGGTSYLIACCANKDKTIFSFDSFSGLPDTTDIDYHKKGEFKASKEDTIKFLSVFPNVKVIGGLVEDTVNIVKDNTFSFVYIDLDIYTSTKFAIEFFWNRITKNGWMLIDDYKWLYTKGVDKAVVEYFGDLSRYTTFEKSHHLGIKK